MIIRFYIDFISILFFLKCSRNAVRKSKYNSQIVQKAKRWRQIHEINQPLLKCKIISRRRRRAQKGDRVLLQCTTKKRRKCVTPLKSKYWFRNMQTRNEGVKPVKSNNVCSCVNQYIHMNIFYEMHIKHVTTKETPLLRCTKTTPRRRILKVDAIFPKMALSQVGAKPNRGGAKLSFHFSNF